MVRYHQSFSEARLTTLNRYRETLSLLVTNEQTANEQQQILLENRETFENRETSLTGSRDERKVLLAELAAKTEDKSVQRTRLINDQLRLEKLIAQLKKSMTTLDGAEFAARKGSLPWPVEGKVNKRFGQARAGGRLKWQGNLILAPTDSSIKAVHRGRVVFADWLRGFGLLTIIDHGDEYMTLYAHSDAILKQVGDFVESGEPIATVGSSGAQSTPSLYFELRQKGIPQNPNSWFSAR
jgi:septal ring factor EnvC (AmiA/AmiB activator)